MKKYAASLVARVRNSDAWPGVALLENFNDLQAQASAALEKGTLEGNLAAILLMHQIAEESLKVLDEDSIFYIQIKLYPYPYLPVRAPKRMFGQIIKDMASTVWFKNKNHICERAGKLNDLRVPIVHGLIAPGAMRGVEKSAKMAWEIYKSFSWHALETHRDFHGTFADYQDDEHWPPREAKLLSEDGSWLE
jgi:hypothetical protein